MANSFYTHSSAAPVSQTRGTSANIRLELDLIAAGFDGVSNSVLGVGVESGTLNNFLITLNPQPTVYPAAGTFTFIATHANTGAATFQLGALAAIPLLSNDGTPLSNNYIIVGEIVQVFTNGTNAYVMGATKSYVDNTAFNSAVPAQAGNAGKFLITNGTIALWSNSVTMAALGAGTAAAPALTLSDVGSGFYRPALNQVALAINGVTTELNQAAGKTVYSSLTFGTGIVFPTNMTSPQLLALTGAPPFIGTGASGTWGINITGTAATANSLNATLGVGGGGTGATAGPQALINLGSLTAATGSSVIPSGTTAQRDATPAIGYFRYNATLAAFEGYSGTAWGSVGGGATGAAGDTVFVENSRVMNTSYTLSTGKSASMVGPLTIATGAVLTVPTNQRLVVL